MKPHEIFGFPASARFSLHGDKLAVWDRLNAVTGKTEISFSALADFPPTQIAKALLGHITHHGIKNLKLKCLKKSITDRLLGMGQFRSGEESRFLLAREKPAPRPAPESGFFGVAPEDASEVERIINLSFASSPNARVCRAWILEDMFAPDWVNFFLTVNGVKAGFGSAIHSKKCGELNYVCLLPEFQHQGYGKALMNRLLLELDQRPHPLLALNAETTNSAAMKLYESYGFRWDGDYYFNLYGK